MIHSLAWVAWLIAALVGLSITRNPLYLVLLVLAVAVVNSAVVGLGPQNRPPVAPARFALAVIPLAVLFNASLVHLGETVLFRLPDAIPIVGGPVTLEAAVYGLVNGLVLAGLLTAFVTLNQALPIRALVGLIPAAFYPVAVVVSIAVTLIPTTLRQFDQIRAAQAVRGHRVRGLRDWLPLVMPLLIGGLERALQLAEALTARGFAAGTGRRMAPRAALAVGLATLLAGWLLRLVWGQAVLGLALMIAGTLMTLGALWWAGRQVPRTTYRTEHWRWSEWLVLLGAALLLASWLTPGPEQSSLRYAPYPRLSLPGFDPWLGLAALGLLAPAVVSRRSKA